MSYSTACNPNYFRANFMDQVTYTIVGTNGEQVEFTDCDPLSPQLQLLLENLTHFEVVKYTGQQFTTLVYNKYGNTTLIWLVLLVNGFMSRTELRSGMMVRWPLQSQIDAAIQQLNLNKPYERTVVI